MRKARRPAAQSSSSQQGCPVCGDATKVRALCKVDAFDIHACGRCRAEFALPVPSDEDLKAYYDRKDWFEGGETGGYKNYDAQTEWSLDWVKAVLGGFKDAKDLSILDVGCGYGTHLKLAAERGWKCFGVEPSDHARAVAQERLGGAAYIVESVDELIPHAFDLILMLDTIEHLPSPYPTLYKLFSIGAITPKTKLVISTPNAGSAEAERDPASWAFRHPPSHLVYYREQTLAYLLKRLRFTSVDVKGLAPTNGDENDLAQCGGLLVSAGGSDFAAFMQERYVPGTWSKIAEYEHVPRYALAAQLVMGKSVLDFGCGTGYGAAMLADAAKSVTGLDIDEAAIAWAKDTHRKPNLDYIRAGDLGAGLPARSFDVITCFEMIEHVDHATQKAVIASFARLLKDDGLMLISTPNPETTALYGANPYHIREMNEAELRDLLSPHFDHVQVLRQHVRAGVAFEREEGAQVGLKPLPGNSAEHGAPLAFIGVCAKHADVSLPAQIAFDHAADFIAETMSREAVLSKTRLDAYRQSEIAQNRKTQIDAVVMERDAALKDREQAQHERNLAKIAVDEAKGQRDNEANLKLQALGERDQARSERDHQSNLKALALTERDHQSNLKAIALGERDQARSERDHQSNLKALALTERDHQSNLKAIALGERDEARAERDHARLAFHHLTLQRQTELQSLRFLSRTLMQTIKARVRLRLGAASDPLIPAQSEKTAAALEALMAKPSAQAASAAPLLCSLIIPTKDGGELFKRVVAGLQRQTIWPQVEFIVVDSGSSDETVAVALAAGAKCYSIPPADFNHGATRDYAIGLATCERIVLSVQDAVPETAETLERLVAALDDAKVAGAYARQIPQPDADAITRRNLNNWLTARPEREVREPKSAAQFDAMPPMEKYLYCNFDNVCSIIRKSVWVREKFGRINFGEDIDWAERVLKDGWRIVYEPAAAVVHSHDRPISYEYKRTYVCHRKLYGQFGLHAVPSLRWGVGAWLKLTLADMAYVIGQSEPWRNKGRLLLKLPALNAMNMLGQYRGAKHEAKGRDNTVRGV